MSNEMSDIEVTSIYGQKTNRGLVQVKLGREEILMPPTKAREVAGFLLECAAAAEGDEALMNVLRRAGRNDTQALQFLMALRSERGLIDRRAREEARRAIARDQFDPDKPD